MKILAYGVYDEVLGQLRAQDHIIFDDCPIRNMDDVLDMIEDTETSGITCVILGICCKHDDVSTFSPREIRETNPTIPLIIIEGENVSELEANLNIGAEVLNNGADYYHLSPVDCELLNASIKACIRRVHFQKHNTVKAGPISINLSRKIVKVGDIDAKLTGKEFQVMEKLALHLGSVVTKEMIHSHLYNLDEAELKIIDVFICKIRKKLCKTNEEFPNAGSHIATVWGRGYALTNNPTLVAESNENSVEAEVA